MIHKTGKYAEAEEEKKINLEYKKKREHINAEELGVMFESKVKTDLAQHFDLFDKIEVSVGQGFYSKLNTSINREQLEELAVKFFYSISEELGERAESIFKGENSDIQMNLVENSDKFFSECVRLKIDGSINFDEKMLEMIRTSDPELYEKLQENNKEKNIAQISISLKGSIGDLYNLVHEITHALISNDNSTVRILDEVATQSMERILDDFLLDLPEEELKKYNFNETNLRRDIKIRKIISFVSRYIAAKDFNKEILEKGSESEKAKETLKYFLAQIFQTQFVKNNKSNKKVKILKFMNCLEEDNLEEAIKNFGMDITNKLRRDFYVQDCINEVKTELEGKKQGKLTSREFLEGSDKDDR